MPKLTVALDERRLARIQKKLEPGVLLPPVSSLIRTLARTTQEEATRNAPSILRSEIETTRISELAAKVSLIHPGGRAMEAGRRPLAAGGNYPPPAAYAYITSDAGQQFAIARAIARRGTKGRFFFKRARAKALRVLPQLINEAAKRIGADWGAP